jgi:hypothetical protein
MIQDTMHVAISPKDIPFPNKFYEGEMKIYDKDGNGTIDANEMITPKIILFAFLSLIVNEILSENSKLKFNNDSVSIFDNLYFCFLKHFDMFHISLLYIVLLFASENDSKVLFDNMT